MGKAVAETITGRSLNTMLAVLPLLPFTRVASIWPKCSTTSRAEETGRKTTCLLLMPCAIEADEAALPTAPMRANQDPAGAGQRCGGPAPDMILPRRSMAPPGRGDGPQQEQQGHSHLLAAA